MPLPDTFVIAPLTPDAARLRGELWDQRRATTRDDFTREYTRVFLVETTDKHTAGKVASLAAGLPAVYAAYSVFGGEADPEAFLTSTEAQPHDNHPNLWAVTCKYESKPQNHPDYQHNDPTQRKRRRRAKYERDKEYRTEDRTGKPYANSSREPFDPVEVPTRYQSVEFRKNLQAEYDDLIEQFLDATNRDAAFGKQPYQLMVDDFYQDDEQMENGVRFWPSTLVLKCKPILANRPKPWQMRVIDRGTRAYNAGTGVSTQLLDQRGRPIGVGLLDGSGGLLGPGLSPVFLDFQPLQEISFAPLANLFAF